MRLLAASAALACCVLLASCAGGSPQLAAPRDTQAPAAAPQRALETIAAGRTTREDLARAIGKAIVVRFDSGNEIWVYRWMGPGNGTRSATELVVLFGPDGVVKKARLRPGYA